MSTHPSQFANDGTTISRRQTLASAIALGARSLLRSSRSRAEVTEMKMDFGTIDVHHHYFPTVFQQDNDTFLKALFGAVPAGIKNWTPSAALETMDSNGVAKAVVNTSSRPPGPGVTTAEYRTQARQANEYAAKMVQNYPRRFAQFGFLPMPDIDGSLKEIEFTLDVLKAPGIGMMTSYGSLWQGNPAFAPVMEELDRRKAVVFCHPLAAACCTKLMPDIVPNEADFVEFPYDTGRAVVSLLISGSFAKYPSIRWIFCHCGDVIPVLSGRIRRIVESMPAQHVSKFAPRGVDYELQRQFYDTADAAYGPPMAAIQNYIPPTQIMFGTDYPYVSIELNAKELHERHLSPAEMAAIQRGNALRLMPQLSD